MPPQSFQEVPPTCRNVASVEKAALTRTLVVAGSIAALCLAFATSIAGGAWIRLSVVVAFLSSIGGLLVTVRSAQWILTTIPVLAGGASLIAGPSIMTRIVGMVLVVFGAGCMVAVARGGLAPGRGVLNRLMSFASMHPGDQRRFTLLGWLRK